MKHPTEKQSEIKVRMPERIKTALKVLATMARVTMPKYIEELVIIANNYFKHHGRHITEDPFLNPAPPIAQILKNIQLSDLAQEIKIPVERLEALVSGDRPTDSDLSFLVAADCVDYSLEQLYQSRNLQFDLDSPEKKNVFR